MRVCLQGGSTRGKMGPKCCGSISVIGHPPNQFQVQVRPTTSHLRVVKDKGTPGSLIEFPYICLSLHYSSPDPNYMLLASSFQNSESPAKVVALQKKKKITPKT